MGLFNFGKKKPTAEQELAQFSYGMAYFFLPQFYYADPARVIGYFANNEFPPGPYLYALACSYRKVQPEADAARAFGAAIGELEPGCRYYALQYPIPPPFEFGAPNATLAPYFSVIVQSDDSESEQGYYILGQGPMGGTTLRAIRRDLTNLNLGPGPAPELAALLDVLREKRNSATVHASHRFVDKNAFQE